MGSSCPAWILKSKVMTAKPIQAYISPACGMHGMLPLQCIGLPCTEVEYEQQSHMCVLYSSRWLSMEL